MFKIKLADMIIAVDNKYDYIEKMCSDYISDEDAEELKISVTDEEIKAETDGGGWGDEYLESLAVYRKIAEHVIGRSGFLMHGVLLDADGTGIAFLAKSGTGKSTHAALWQRMLGKRCEIINGDKPIVRIGTDGRVYAYGTPWCGKEGIHQNKKIELKKVCFIERSSENSVMSVPENDVLKRLMSQIYMPKNGMQLVKTLDTVNSFIKNTEFYIIRCNKDISAAETAYKGIFKE